MQPAKSRFNLVFILQLCTCYLGLGLSSNIFAGDTPTPEEALNYGVRYISITEAKNLFDSNQAVFCDARITREYITETIPNAIPCLYEEVGGKDNKHPNFNDTIETWHTDKLANKNTTLIVFCNAKNCWRSYKAAAVAKKHGFTDIRWLRDGVPGWKSAGYRLENNCPL